MGSIDGIGAAKTVPIVDLSPFTNPSSSVTERQEAAKGLASALTVDGCVGIKGHGVPARMLERGFATAQQLFDLPYQDKMKAPHPAGIIPHRGYTGLGLENGGAKGAYDAEGDSKKGPFAQTLDYKESYEIGSEEEREHYNIWLPEETLPGFRDFTTELYWRINDAAQAILNALILSLGLTAAEVERVRSMHNGHTNQLRLLHYPVVPKEFRRDNKGSSDGDDSICRLGQHKDWSSFTLVWQKNVPGLEFLNRETGSFMPATLQDGVVWLNIGDMFERLSNGAYPSAVHRVVANTSDAAPRYSMPYFCSPSSDAFIEPLPSSVAAAAGKQRYEAMTAKEYQDRMFKLVRKDAA